jgi:hypothetical protein
MQKLADKPIILADKITKSADKRKNKNGAPKKKNKTTYFLVIMLPK